jgi:ribonuclease BN (tRNA processing enzyme)
MVHKRFIFPVGQGGFAGEKIGKTIVLFDCGSLSSDLVLHDCIDFVRQNVSHVDYLFISHFDEDHVNGLKYLLYHVKVERAIVSWIPDKLRLVYGVYTNGAYTSIMEMLKGKDIDIDEIGKEEGKEGKYVFKIWEWVAKSMMTQDDFDKIEKELKKKKIKINSELKVEEIERRKKDINKAFKNVFGNNGPNTKGLIMLSQKSGNSNTSTTIYQGCMQSNCMKLKCCYIRYKDKIDNTSCLYVGDAKLKGRNVELVKRFLEENMGSSYELLMMQIPHHGSQHNIGAHFENDFSAHYYFVNDINTKRLEKNMNLYTSLTNKKKLMVSSASWQYLIWTHTEINPLVGDCNNPALGDM